VQSHAHPRLPFFASLLRLGREGVEEVLPLGQLSAYEEEGLKVRMYAYTRAYSVKGTCLVHTRHTNKGANWLQ
jgi:hypothetical protein